MAIKVPSADYVTAFSFSRPLKPQGGKEFESGSVDLLLAYTEVPPSDISNANSGISRHTVARVITEDFVALAKANKGNISVPTNGNTASSAALNDIDRATVILIHGICMFIAWGVSPFIG